MKIQLYRSGKVVHDLKESEEDPDEVHCETSQVSDQDCHECPCDAVISSSHSPDPPRDDGDGDNDNESREIESQNFSCYPVGVVVSKVEIS